MEVVSFFNISWRLKSFQGRNSAWDKKDLFCCCIATNELFSVFSAASFIWMKVDESNLE